MKNIKEQIDSIINDFKPKNSEPQPKAERAASPVAFWLPPTYKAKFDDVQNRTDKKFGKALQALVMNVLDSVE